MAVDRQIFQFEKYRKQPVLVECAKLTEDAWQDLHELPNHVMYVSGRQVCATEDKDHKYFLIDTLEGLMKANIGDMLIIGVKGEIYACEKEIFDQTYKKGAING